jgi:hypothetical protein
MISHKKTLSNIRLFCLECDNAERLVDGQCQVRKCHLYENRQEMIEQSQQLSIFTKEGFFEEVNYILSIHSDRFLRDMYFSDLRALIESIMNGKKAKLPDGNQLKAWWGSVPDLLKAHGWVKTKKYRRTKTRNRDYLYYRETFKTNATAEAWWEDMGADHQMADAINDAEMARL